MRESQMGRVFTVLTFLNLLLMAIGMGGMVFFGLSNPTILSGLLAAWYLTEVVLWVGALCHGLQVLLEPKTAGVDVFIVCSELLFAFFLTPSVFTVWQAVFGQPFLFFDLFAEPLFSRFWVLSRVASLYVLLIKVLGNRWLRRPDVETLTLSDIPPNA